MKRAAFIFLTIFFYADLLSVWGSFHKGVIPRSRSDEKPRFEQEQPRNLLSRPSGLEMTGNVTAEADDGKKTETGSSSSAITIGRKDIQEEKSYRIVKVVDGDTVDADIDGKIERVRLIGINTPETVDPRRPVECFGKEASAEAKKLLSGKRVRLEADKTQSDRDKYGRLLRYVTTEDGVFFNLEMISLGYAYEYTYDLPYKYQRRFKDAQKEAEAKGAGLWAPGACGTADRNKNCLIKGNINVKGEKIYHLPDCPYYDRTMISEADGEKWFCTEEEAAAAGWRKAENCP